MRMKVKEYFISIKHPEHRELSFHLSLLVSNGCGEKKTSSRYQSILLAFSLFFPSFFLFLFFLSFCRPPFRYFVSLSFLSICCCRCFLHVNNVSIHIRNFLCIKNISLCIKNFLCYQELSLYQELPLSWMRKFPFVSE